MTAGQKKMGVLSKIIYLVKVEMESNGVSESKAYDKILQTQIYGLLKNTKTGLYLEPAEYIKEAYEIETNNSAEKMMEFIKI